jgi:multidrug efflux system membrane fusion protein
VRDVPYYIDEIGRTAAREMVTVTPQVAGRIDEAHFVEGDDVNKGDLLFTIDARPYKAALAQADAALNQSKENLNLAKIEFARVEALKGTSAVSETEYDQKKSAVAVAEANVQAAQANVDAARLNVEYCEIRSPITGRTGKRLVDPGNVVKANEGSLVTIQRMDPINADFTIAEDRLSEVRDNMANGRLETFVQRPQTPGIEASTTQPAPRKGELAMIDNTVQDNTGTVRLRATIPNKDHFFWPGQFVKIRLVLHQKKDAILIPSKAIQVGQQGPYVYVIKHDDEKKVDLAEMRPIVQGQIQGDLIVIDKGLNAGDKVITTGQMMVMPNGPVTVVPAQGGAQVAEAKS